MTYRTKESTDDSTCDCPHNLSFFKRFFRYEPELRFWEWFIIIGIICGIVFYFSHRPSVQIITPEVCIDSADIVSLSSNVTKCSPGAIVSIEKIGAEVAMVKCSCHNDVKVKVQNEK